MMAKFAGCQYKRACTVSGRSTIYKRCVFMHKESLQRLFPSFLSSGLAKFRSFWAFS